MRQPKRQTRRAFVAAAGSAFASVGVMRAPARAAEFEWKLSHNLPIGSPLHVRAIQCVRAIKTETNGRLDITVFPFNQLGSDPAVFSQLRAGAVQVYVGSGGLWGTVVPVANIENVGFAFKTANDAFRAFDGPLGAYVRKEAETRGLVVLDRVWDNGMRNITSSTHPIRSAADLEGFKIRTPAGRMWVDLFKQLGASPTPINPPELYTALQTHIVDGQENALFGIDAYRLYEVQKYLSLTNHMFAGYWFVVNPDAWKSIGPQLQAVVQRNVSRYGLLQRRDTELQNDSYQDKLHREGIAVNHADTASMRARLGPLYAKWKTDFGQAWTLLEDSVGKLG